MTIVLPYGPAPAASFILHELAMYALFALCLIDARQRGGRFLSYLLGGALFGLMLEAINVNAGMNYSYGQFWIMLGPTPEPGAIPQNIPLNIGLGWGIILYAVRLFSDRLAWPVWARAAVDALLALNIDLAMDIVAYRLNMWHWGWEFFAGDLDPLRMEYFGVPYANFFGWLAVVFFYGWFGRLLIDRAGRQTNRKWLWLPLSTLGALVLSQILLFVTITTVPTVLLRFYRPYFRPNFGPFAVMTLVFAAFLLFLIFRARQKGAERPENPHQTPDSLLIWLVPTYFHLYFLSWFLIEGYYQESVWLTGITLANGLIGLFLHQRINQT